jgi:hypothetical protein
VEAAVEGFDPAQARGAPTDGSECTAEIFEEETRESLWECREELDLENANQIATHGTRCNVLRKRLGPYSRGRSVSKGECPSRPAARLRVSRNQISKAHSR